MTQLGTDFHKHNLLVTQSVQMDNESFDIPALAGVCDWLIPMLYDENAGRAKGRAGCRN